MQIESVAVTNVGLVRSMNQDAILEMTAEGVYVVADGMGGEKAGEEASAQVIETLEARFGGFFKKQPTGPSAIEGEMRDALLQANRDVFQISVREPEKRGLGSTSSVLCLHRGVYFCAQVGDSRIYLLREGNVQQITRDHTLVWALYEQGAITREQLETHPDRHLLTQCIGNERPVKVDTFMGQVQVGDTFLICSDGLTGYAKEPKVFEILKQEDLDLKMRADMLVQSALDAGGGDNVSVVLARIASLDPAVDVWEPEATAPPVQLSELDAAHAFATSIHRPEDLGLESTTPNAKGPAKPGAGSTGAATWIAGIVLVLAIAAVAFAWVMRPKDAGEVRVYLPPGETAPQSLTIRLTQGDKTLPAEQTASDDQGVYFLLPGPGDYSATFEAEGYLPQQIQINASEEAAKLQLKKKMAWTRAAMLTLALPADPAPEKVSVLAEGGQNPAAHDVVFDAEALKKGSGELAVALVPGVTYRVKAEAAGHDFVSPPQQLDEGAKRTLKVYWND